ncbi:MAG: hypothetical protein JJ966_07145 [Balneolaceae bacterium]|nr:hypothetical protein [Balneolaceae bacterium]
MKELSQEIAKYRWAIAGIFVLQFIYVLYAAWSTRIFYPDGTIFFTHILQVVEPVHWHWDRQFAYYVQHSPLILSIKSGITDIFTLARIHTFWYFSFGLISLVANWFIIPKEKKAYFLFPLIWMFGFYFNTEFFPITPGRLLTALFWMIFNLMLFHRSWRSIILIVIIGWPLLRIYQGMLILGPLLGVLAFWKAWAFKDTDKFKMLSYLIIGLYMFAGALLSFLSVLDPQDKTSFVTFIIGFLLVFDEELYPHWPQFLSLFAFGYFAISVWKPQLFKSTKQLFVPFLHVFSGAVFLMPIIWAESLAPETHQQVRSLNIYFTALLAIVAFFVAQKKIKISREIYRSAVRVFLIIAFVQIGWAIQATMQWNEYLDIFKQELASLEPGLHLAQETTLLDINEEYGLSNGMHNDWDTVLMSILFSPDDSVKAIIAHAYGNVYFPVDPYDASSVPDLSAYGKNMDKYFNALARQDTVLVPDRPLPDILKWFSTETVGENDYFED